MNKIAQFRAYVNRYGYFKNGRYMVEIGGKEYVVSAIWKLIEMGLFGTDNNK